MPPPMESATPHGKCHPPWKAQPLPMESTTPLTVVYGDGGSEFFLDSFCVATLSAATNF